jgi:hypothetical protein
MWLGASIRDLKLKPGRVDEKTEKEKTQYDPARPVKNSIAAQ